MVNGNAPSAPSLEQEPEVEASKRVVDMPNTASEVSSSSRIRQLLKRFPQGRNLWIVLVIALLVIGAIAAAVIGPKSKTTTSPAQTPGAKSTQIATIPAAQIASFIPLDKPIKLANLNFFNLTGDYFGDQKNCSHDKSCPTFTYYQIGTSNGKRVLDVLVGNYGLGEVDYIALDLGGSKYNILGRMSSSIVPSLYNFNGSGVDSINSLLRTLQPNVKLDKVTAIKDLLFPQSIKASGMQFSNSFSTSADNFPKQAIVDGDLAPSGYLTADGLASIQNGGLAGAGGADISPTALVNIGSSGNKTIYQYSVTPSGMSSSDFQEVYTYAAVSGVYSGNYVQNDLLATNTNSTTTRPAPITWSDGTKNTYAYTNPVLGCGFGSPYMITKNISPSSLVAIGTDSSGRAIYKLPNNSSLLGKEYADYKSAISIGTGVPKALQNMSIAQFQAARMVIVVKNSLNQYEVFERYETAFQLFPAGGCAKPVIYLYPTSPELVNLRVGADVTKSDPIYGRGWNNVLAQPNGQLTYDGQFYDSLYWEGYGYGNYPLILSGTIVNQSQLVPTIKLQLAEQGFNTKETKDFLDYWQSKLPATPYIRLSWLTTQQMNQLAPLYIYPAPNTVIRTFLDFQGLSKPTQITPQHFTAPARNGFTVVEWGGLLRSGL